MNIWISNAAAPGTEMSPIELDIEHAAKRVDPPRSREADAALAENRSAFIQARDFTGNFVPEMDMHTRSRCPIAVLSPDYLTYRFAASELAARFASEHDLLTAVRLRCGEAVARDTLLRRIQRVRLKPHESEASNDIVPVQPALKVKEWIDSRTVASERSELHRQTGRRRFGGNKYARGGRSYGC